MGKGKRGSGESEQDTRRHMARRDGYRSHVSSLTVVHYYDQSTITLYKFILYMGTFMA